MYIHVCVYIYVYIASPSLSLYMYIYIYICIGWHKVNGDWVALNEILVQRLAVNASAAAVRRCVSGGITCLTLPVLCGLIRFLRRIESAAIFATFEEHLR